MPLAGGRYGISRGIAKSPGLPAFPCRVAAPDTAGDLGRRKIMSEQRCPRCLGPVGLGSSFCERCGYRLAIPVLPSSSRWPLTLSRSLGVLLVTLLAVGYLAGSQPFAADIHIPPTGAIALAALYFIPSGIAALSKHHNTNAIFALNLLLGWTLLGWVGALVWALAKPAPSR